MGLATWWKIRRMHDPVRGALRVGTCPQPDTAPDSFSYAALVEGVVEAPGLPPQTVRFNTTVPARRCPRSGQRVLVMVDRANAAAAVLWQDVPQRPRVKPGLG
ncbi:hypothetical protein GCM10027408_36500 [Microbacterium tumbae]